MSEERANETEFELKRRLGIDSWRNLSKDKFMTFVSDLPNLDKDVALKVIGQFPDFKNLVLDTFKQVQEQSTQGISFNHKSQKKVQKAFKEYRMILSRELERVDLTSEDRFKILELLKDAIDSEALSDKENKEFLLKSLGIITTSAVAIVGIAFAVLGGKTSFGRSGVGA